MKTRPFVSGNEIHDSIQNNSNATTGACGFKMEKPKMPKFTGNVREYAIFRADFKHAIESSYSKRDNFSSHMSGRQAIRIN